MSILEQGMAEREEWERRQREIREYRTEENRQRTLSWFRRDFYRDPAYRVPNPDRSAWVRTIENPDHPYPEVSGFALIEDGYFADAGHFASTFTCEGIRYVCHWGFEGTGGDRAYWDDGWWPNWYVVVRRRRRWLPVLHREIEVAVHSPAQVAGAVGARPEPQEGSGT